MKMEKTVAKPASADGWISHFRPAGTGSLLTLPTVSSSTACQFPMNPFPLVQDAFLSGQHLTSTCSQLEPISWVAQTLLIPYKILSDSFTFQISLKSCHWHSIGNKIAKSCVKCGWFKKKKKRQGCGLISPQGMVAPFQCELQSWPGIHSFCIFSSRFRVCKEEIKMSLQEFIVRIN